jgi:hypothetical protein
MRTEPGSPVRSDTDAGALVDRLQKLRKLLPAFAQETAAARREAARLRLQNTTLQTRLAELEARPRSQVAKRDGREAISLPARRGVAAVTVRTGSAIATAGVAERRGGSANGREGRTPRSRGLPEWATGKTLRLRI